MPKCGRSSLFLNNLWLFNISWWSSLLLINIDFKINRLVLEAVFTFNNLSSILNAQNTSVILTVVTSWSLWLVLSIQSLLSVEVSLSFWFSADVTLLFGNWVRSCLSGRSYGAHSFSWILDSLVSSFVSLLSEFLLIEVVIQVLLNSLHLSSVALGNLDLLSAWSFSSSSWALLSTALFVRAAD